MFATRTSEVRTVSGRPSRLSVRGVIVLSPERPSERSVAVNSGPRVAERDARMQADHEPCEYYRAQSDRPSPTARNCERSHLRPPRSCCRTRLPARGAPRKLETSTTCGGRLSGFAGEPRRQLGTGANAQLPVGTRQHRLDGVLREEECRRDLAIRVTLRDERRDPPLALRQLPPRGRAATDPCQLGPRPLGPERCAEPLEDLERLLERRPGGSAPLRCRRWVTPSASSVRAWWNGSTLRACSASARSNSANALCRSPRAESRSARQRARQASAHALSSARARFSQGIRIRSASSSSPIAIRDSSVSASSKRSRARLENEHVAGPRRSA